MSTANKMLFRKVGLSANEVLARGSEGEMEGKPVSDFALALLASETDAQARTLLNVQSGSTTLAAGSIMIQAGDLLAAQTLPVDYAIQALAPAGYELTGWDLWVYPAGVIELDVRRCALNDLPMVPAYTMVPNASFRPGVNNVETGSGDVSGWGQTFVSQSDALNITVIQNTGVKWLTLLLKGNRP